MRILCCVNRDLASNYALNLLLPDLVRRGHSIRIVISERVGRPGANAIQAFRAVEQSIPNELIFPLVERCLQPRNRSLTFTEMSVYCDSTHPLSLDLNSEAGVALLNDFAPDLVVTIRYGHILRDQVIGSAKHGVINLHSGLLPEYRGILSTLQAMIHGETDIGCTLHWIVDAKIDTGPIIATARRPVERGRSLLWHILSLYPLGVPLIAETVRRLTSGEPVPRQAQSGGTYYSTPTAADVDALAARGVELFDADDLRDLIARYVPSPSASAGS